MKVFLQEDEIEKVENILDESGGFYYYNPLSNNRNIQSYNKR